MIDFDNLFMLRYMLESYTNSTLMCTYCLLILSKHDSINIIQLYEILN